MSAPTRTFLRAVFAVAVTFLLAACGSPPPKAKGADRSTAWFGALVDPTSDWQIRIRPREAAEDPVFGPVLRRAEREAASEVGNLLVGQTALAAFEKTDAVVAVVRRSHPLDTVIILAGVPGSTSPDSLVDEQGRPLWKKVDARVRGTEEYARFTPDGASTGETVPSMRLVVLPGRTWVIALGDAVERMYVALGMGTPGAYRPDPGSLFEIDAEGELLGLLKQRKSRLLEPLLGSLTRAELMLEGGKKPELRLVLTYPTPNDASHAADFVQTVITAFQEKAPKYKEILDSAKVTTAGEKVLVDAYVPDRIVRQLVDAENPGTPL